MSTSQKFNIPCPSCGQMIAVSHAHIGKKGRCPNCKTVFPINAPQQVGPAPVEAELIPIAASGGLQPLGPLTPLSPLTPLHPAAPGAQGWNAPAAHSAPSPFAQPAPSPFGQPAPSPFGQPAASPFGAPAIPNPYGQAPAPSPFGQPAGFGPSGFGAAPASDDYNLAPSANPYAAPSTSNSPAQDALRRAVADQSWGNKKERSEMNGTLLGGIGMMILAVVWFVGGLFAGIIFFYPPILFIIGLVAFVRGLVNMASS